MDKNALLHKALNAQRESKYVDFKSEFNVENDGDWCELIKDIIAMTNSGGGVIIFGIKNNGSFSGFDVTPVLNYDPANITNKISKYTNEQFSNFEIEEIERDKNRMAVIVTYGVSIPIVFAKPGTYAISDKQQKTVFSQGTVYFRHGAKSEPGNSNDMREFIERELARIRESWLGNIRKVVTAPPGHQIQVVPQRRFVLKPGTPVRLVNGQDGEPVTAISFDETHPYRRKDVIEIVNERLSGRKTINSHDIICVRDIYGLEENSKYCFDPKYSSPQYSEAFIDYLVNGYEKDNRFFKKARNEYKNRS